MASVALRRTKREVAAFVAMSGFAFSGCGSLGGSASSTSTPISTTTSTPISTDVSVTGQASAPEFGALGASSTELSVVDSASKVGVESSALATSWTEDARIAVDFWTWAVVPVEGEVWLSGLDGSVTVLDAETYLSVPKLAGLEGFDVVKHENVLWLGGPNQTLIAFDPVSGVVETSIEVGFRIMDLDIIDGELWVLANSGMVLVIDLESRAIRSTIEVGPLAMTLVTHNGSVVVTSGNGSLTRIDRESLSIVARLEDRSSLAPPLPIGGEIWTVAPDNGLRVHDTETLEKVGEIRLRGLDSMALIDGKIWTYGQLNTIYVIDPERKVIVETVDVGGSGSTFAGTALTKVGDNVWALVQAYDEATGSTFTRIEVVDPGVMEVVGVLDVELGGGTWALYPMAGKVWAIGNLVKLGRSEDANLVVVIVPE